MKGTSVVDSSLADERRKVYGQLRKAVFAESTVSANQLTEALVCVHWFDDGSDMVQTVLHRPKFLLLLIRNVGTVEAVAQRRLRFRIAKGYRDRSRWPDNSRMFAC